MKRNMMCLRGSVLFGLLLALGLVGPWLTNAAMAQVRPALTASVDDPGRTPYKATIRQYCFLVDAACDFTFPTVPAGKRLVIKHVSGYFSSRQADATQFLFVSVRRGGDDVSFLPTTYQGPGFGAHIFVFNQDVLEYYNAAEAPIVRIATGDRGYPIMGGVPGSPLPFYNIVTVGGYLVDCSTGPCQPIVQ